MKYSVLHAESFILVTPYLADYTYVLSARSPTEILLLSYISVAYLSLEETS